MTIGNNSSAPNRHRLLWAIVLTLTLLGSAHTARPASAQEPGQNELPPQTSAISNGTAAPMGVTQEACTIIYTDVRAGDYYYEPVRYLSCQGAISGYPDNTFRPGNNATRGQLAKIITIAKGWPLITPATPSFSDVTRANPFYAYIETTRARGVINGYSDGTFRPNAEVTRSQLTKIVVGAESWGLVNPSSPTFADVSRSHPFYQYIETAARNGAISGYGDSTFRPGNTATRAQISKIIYSASAGVLLTPQEQATVDLINVRRAARGLGALRVNLALTSAARRHSNDIGPRQLCQHNGTDGSSPWDRIAQAGYGGFGMGEVVGCNYNSPQAVVEGWWNSPGHVAVLVDPAANDIGCGWWLGTNGYGWQTCVTGNSSR